jgi:steroid delta-isomerase-like uncharacterized protein
MSAENKALMRRWFEEVWSQGRVAAIDEMMSTRVVVQGLGDNVQDIAGFKQFHTMYRSAFPDVRIQVDDVIAEGDKVAVRWSGSGTHRGNDLGFPATGTAIQFTGMTFARVENGKLVEGWNVFDQLGMLQQLGVVNLPV